MAAKLVYFTPFPKVGRLATIGFARQGYVRVFVVLVNVHLKCSCFGMFDNIHQKFVSKLVLRSHIRLFACGHFSTLKS